VGNGGGIYNSGGSPQIIGCRFSDNTAYQGGGILTRGGTPLISGCTFLNNTATSEGGGLYGYSSGSDLIIEDCLFSGNISQDNGGGLCIMYDTHLINVVIAGNTAANDGGGVMTWIGSPDLTNCTIANNRAGRGGGMAFKGTTARMDNTILWHNTAVTAGDQIALLAHPNSFFTTDFTGEACDLQGGAADIFIEDPACILTWTNGISTDPQLVDPGTWTDPGTPGDLFDDTWQPGDYHLCEASPCIDTGNDAALHLPAFDYDGDPRRIDGDGDATIAVDIGADEYMQAITCPGDLNGDGDVDGSDLAQLAGSPSVMDVGVFASNFGKMDCE
jgi:hypothetical protein